MEYTLAIIGGYLLGSIPFGLVLTKLAGYGDIRDIGSGNIGATNVLRTGNKPLALLTLILDATKGAVAVILAISLMNVFYMDCSTMVFTGDADTSRCRSAFDFQMVPMAAGFFALIGHLFPAWLKFKGGKGVATTLGTFIAIQPLVGLTACVIWFMTAVITRYSSLSALVALGTSPIVAQILYGDSNLTGFCGIIASIVFLQHRPNIKRLLARQEPKIGKK